MIKLILLAALAFGPSFAEKTGTAHPKLAEPPAMEGCDASELGTLVGKPFNDALKEKAREESGSIRLRVIRPGQAVTQDFSLNRLNLELDASDRIIAVRCG